MSTDSNNRHDYTSPAMRDDLKWSGARREIERLQRELAAANARNAELETANKEMFALQERLSDLLRGTANALKGQPDERMLHSWHDLPEWGAKARAVAMFYLAATAPGATHLERENFVLALQAWRELFGRDLFETALAFSMLDTQPDA